MAPTTHPPAERLKAAAMEGGGRSAPLPLPLPASGPGSDQFMTALATEHFTLATSRASTVAEAGARSTLFMGTVSSFVVALAFIGTVSEVGPVFELFALALLPVLFALGLLTYLRLSESALEDVFYAKAINRIRRYYLEVDPSRAGYIALSANDDFAGVMASAGHRGSRWHTMSHTATMVLVVTGVIGGAGIGLFSSLAFNASYGLATAIAGLTATTVVTMLLGLEQRRWTSVEEQLPPLFPGSTETASSRARPIPEAARPPSRTRPSRRR